MNNIDLNDKVAVVTGAAQGFGLAIAKRISESGAKVVIWDKDEEILKQVKLRNSFNLTVDVTSFENVSKAVETTLNQYRKIDILVNNAGIAGPSFKTWEYPNEEWQKIMKVVNLNGLNQLRSVINFGRQDMRYIIQ